jgi:hypothetical protein
MARLDEEDAFKATVSQATIAGSACPLWAATDLALQQGTLPLQYTNKTEGSSLKLTPGQEFVALYYN